MNRKIYLPLVAVVVAVTAGVFAYDQVDYNPFADSNYADSISTQTVENPLLSYSGDKPITKTVGLYRDYSFNEVIDNSDVILSGSIKNVKVVESTSLVNDKKIISANTVYTVIVHSVQKGNPSNEIKYVTSGGEGENVVTIGNGFVFEKSEQLIVMLKNYEFNGEKMYTPVTNAGEFKVTNGGPNSGEVHKYGEDTTVPLPVFKSIILEVIG